MLAISRELEDWVWWRAYELWKEAGRPEGRGDEFRRQARVDIMPSDVPEAEKYIRLASSFGNESPHNGSPKPGEPLA